MAMECTCMSSGRWRVVLHAMATSSSLFERAKVVKHERAIQRHGQHHAPGVTEPFTALDERTFPIARRFRFRTGAQLRRSAMARLGRCSRMKACGGRHQFAIPVM